MTNQSEKVTFRPERFIDQDIDFISLIKIGEYVRTPLFEPSMRAICFSLTDVRKQLDVDRKRNEKFNQAWKMALKIYQMRASYFKTKFNGPAEYCVALICFTLDAPYKIYEEFNRKCQELVTDAWGDFPFKSLLYLLIQAEMRLKPVEETEGPVSTIKRPITITTDLDYSITEEDGEDETSLKDTSDTTAEDKPKILSPSRKPGKQSYRVYRGLNYSINHMEFQPRNLVAFNQLISATLNGQKLLKIMEASGKKTTIIEIDQLSWSSRSIASLSVFPVENEVVIWPWIKFYVEERKMISENVEKIVLKPTSQSFTESKS